MKSAHRLLAVVCCPFLLFGPAGGGKLFAAGSNAATARVQGILGRAQVSHSGGPFLPLAGGAELQAGDVVRTASESALDLALGALPGKVRVTQNSTLSLDKLVLPEKPAGTFEVNLNLRAGEILVDAKTFPADARFEIRTALGLAQVFGGRVRVQARSYLVVTQGKTIFAYVPAGGQPVAHTLTGPPACYFTPLGGVQPAPPELAKEVDGQLRSKLPKK